MQPVSRFKQNSHLFQEEEKSLLDTVLENPQENTGTRLPVHLLDHFIKENNEWKMLNMIIEFFRCRNRDGKIDKKKIARHIQTLVASFDYSINKQINIIIHNPRFQKLEASWRGLFYLVEQVDLYDEEGSVKVRVLDLSWKNLAKDLDKAIEFDQSDIFQKVYSEEFDTPGGEPYGVLLGDYEISHKRQSGSYYNDAITLRQLSQVTAAAFSPFIGGAHPSLLGLDDFSELELGYNIADTFNQPEYITWRSLRDSEDSRYLGLTAPKVLVRPPYSDDGTRIDNFIFKEDTSDFKKNYLWGNSVYAFGSVIVRAYCESGWFANIRGYQRGSISGGIVTDLLNDSFNTESSSIVTKPSTDTLIGDRLEKELADEGIIPLSVCKETQNLVFYSNNSLQKPKTYDKLVATTNARLSAMLQYILCVSRFAHYIKVMAREKIGSFATAEEVEKYLERWLLKYSTANEDSSIAIKAKHPLRSSSVEIREIIGKPGSFQCITHLQPHFQLDQLVSSVKMVTEVSAAGARK